MCISIPVKVLDVSDSIAYVDLKGERREVYAEIVTPKKGDWVLVYANQVMEIIPKAKALHILESMKGEL